MNFLPLCRAIIQHQQMSKSGYGFGVENNRKAVDMFWVSGSDDPIILPETTGSCSETITLPEGGNYIDVIGNNFTGHLEMNIE